MYEVPAPVIYDGRKAPEVCLSIIALGRLSCGEDHARPTINTKRRGEDPASPTNNTNDAGKTLRVPPKACRAENASSRWGVYQAKV